jgi:hypothetical protein
LEAEGIRLTLMSGIINQSHAHDDHDAEALEAREVQHQERCVKYQRKWDEQYLKNISSPSL